MSAQPDIPAYDNPAVHVIECPFCGRLAHGVTEGRWTDDGVAYTQIVYACSDCPAVDPHARAQRPPIVLPETPPRRRPRIILPWGKR